MAPSRTTRGNRINVSASPGRTSTRGFTPPIASAPQILTRRFTRSNSREADPAGPASNTGRTQRGARAASAEAVDRSVTNVAGGRAAKRNKRMKPSVREDPELSMVQEDSATENPQLQQDDSPIDDEDGPGFVPPDLKTSDLAKLNHPLMIKSLADLFQNSTKIIDLLIPPGASEGATSDVARQIRTKESFESKYFEKATVQFVLDKDSFGSNFYLDLPVAMRALSKVPITKRIKDGPWRPDDLLYKANLTVMAVSVLPSRGRDEDIENVLEDLDRLFPIPFLTMVKDGHDWQPGSSSLYKDTLDLALEIRTQYLISQLTKESENPNFMPSQILQKIFFDTTQFREWNIYVTKKDDKLRKSFTTNLKKRIEQLKSCISNEIGNLVDLDLLERLYPWSGFIKHLASWIRSRADEIDDHVKSQGGIEEVVRSLSIEVGKRPALILPQEEATNTLSPTQSQASRFQSVRLQSPRSVSSRIAEVTASQSNPDPPAEAPRSTRRLVFGSPADISFLKRLLYGGNPLNSEDNSAATPSASHSPRPHDLGSPVRLSYNQASNATAQQNPMETNEDLFVPETQPESAQPLQDDEYQPNFGDDQLFGDQPEEHQPLAEASGTQLPSSSAPPAPSQRARKIQAELKRNREAEAANRAAQSKQRTFTDRQDTAQRVRWDSQTPDGSGQEFANPTIRINGKRPAADLEGSDEEFQDDDRNVDVRARRLQKPAPRSRPPPPREQEEEDDDGEDDNPASAQLLREQQAATESTTTPTVPAATATVTPPPGSQGYANVNKAAKLQAAASRSPKVQTRRAWTGEETTTLMEGLSAYGPAWSKIKDWDRLMHPETNDGGGVLVGRDQVALKDKARNMKVDYLKVREPLPPGFEHVALGKKEKEKVIAAGGTVE